MKFPEMNNEVLIRGLSTLTDSQFIAWIAMNIGENGGSLNEYVSNRLDRIGLLIEAVTINEDKQTR